MLNKHILNIYADLFVFTFLNFEIEFEVVPHLCISIYNTPCVLP